MGSFGAYTISTVLSMIVLRDIQLNFPDYKYEIL